MRQIFLNKALTFILTAVLLCHWSCNQKNFLAYNKEYCGRYYKTAEKMHQEEDSVIAFYNFQPGQTVASIGAQCASWEAMVSAMTNEVHFYLEDIDSTYFNEKQTAYAWAYYSNLVNKPITRNYTLVLGNEKETLLPDQHFDKVIIINSFHEFSEIPAMLADIKTKLKANGLLYILELLPKKPGDKHGGCLMRLFTEKEITETLLHNGYNLIDARLLQHKNGKGKKQIYVFRPNQ